MIASRSSRQPRISLWRMIVALLVVLGVTSSRAADGPEATTNVLEFRKVQIQREQLAEFARGYLPIRETEFNQLLADASRRTQQGGPSSAGCPRAEYSARFENDSLVDGRARLDVHAGGALPTIWTWGETNLPVKSPAWQADPPRPALLGLVASGSQAVFVESSGTLTFDWSRRGERVSRDAVLFTLHMPHGAFQTLKLDLPSSLVPVCRDAIIQRIPAPDVAPASPATETQDQATKNAPRAPAGSRVFWLIQWQGDRELALRLVLNSARRSTGPAARVRQDLLYSIDPRGLELQADLHIDVGSEPLQSLVLTIDRRLRIGTVRLGDKPLTWNRRSPTDSIAHDELIVQIPELSGEDRRIQVSALAPLELGTLWTLPSLQPQGMLWLEGEAQVTVHEPLVATHFDAHGGRLVGSTGAGGERRRSWRVRLQEPDAQLNLTADLPPTRLKIRCGTSITADVTNMSARYTAELTPLNGSVFSLEAEMPRAWSIDGVESLEGPAIEEYQISGSTAQGRQILRVRLHEPLAAGRTLRLVVRARRTPPTPNTPIGAEQLRLLRFRNGGGAPHDVYHVVALNNAPNTRLRFAGDQAVTWIEPSTLAESDEWIVETSSGGRIFVADRAADDLEVRFERDRPRFRAELEVAASIRSDRLVEFYRLRLIPDSSVLDRVPVYFTRARATPLQWKLEQPQELAPGFRRLAPTGDAGAELGETWEVIFARPLSSPVTLTAERNSPIDDATTISLASLPEASEQRGMLMLAANTGPGRWHSRGLRPLAKVLEQEVNSAAQLLGVTSGTVAFFEYEPTSGGAASVSLEPDRPLLRRVWAVQSHVATMAVPDGTLLHRCEYELENVGASEVTFELKAESRLQLQRVLIHGVDRTPPEPEANEGENRREIRCALPVGVRRVRVQLELSERQPSFGVFHQLEMPRVTTDFPLLEQNWQVSLPKAWSVWSVAGPTPSTAPAAADYDASQLWPLANWNHRLFGLILRDDPPRTTTRADVRNGWSLNPPQGSAPPLGWHVFQLRVASDDSITLQVCRAPVLVAIAWVTLLISAMFVGWIGSRRSGVLPMIVLVAGLVALTVPGILAVVASGCFLGTLFAPLVALGLNRSAILTTGTPRISEGETTTAGMVVPLLLLAMVASEFNWSRPIASAVGQETPKDKDKDVAPGPAVRVIQRVLFPVNEQRERVGDYVHVPREFYHELRRQAGIGEATPAAFVIHSADYDVTLRDGENPFLDLVVDYGVEVRQPNARITWPAAPGRVTLIETSVTRSGEAVETDWQLEDTGWTATFERPGSYHVRFRLHVPPNAAGATTADLAVPPVACSQVHLRSEGAASRLTLANDACGPEETGERGERRLSLGPTPRLRFQWAPSTDAPVVAQADHLYWLSVRPGSVQLDFGMRLVPAIIPPSRTIRLRHDPQLRLLPIVGNASIVRAQAAPGQSGLLLVELAESDEPIDLRLSFLLSRATGVGRIAVPRVEWLDGRTDRRWLAVTVTPSLELSRPEGGSMEPLQVPAFLQAWGPTDSLPLVAYRLSPDDESGILAIRQHDSEWTANETTSYLLRRDRGELSWLAEIAVGTGPLFQYEVQCGGGAVRILDVAITEGPDQQARLVRWAIDKQGTLQILADQGLSAPHRLLVRADFPLPFDKEVPLPTLSLVAKQPAPRAVHILRNDSVLLDQVVMDGWTKSAESDSDAARQPATGSHRVGAWTWKSSPDETQPPTPLVRVRANRPRSRGRLLTSLVATGENWYVTVNGLIQADRGRIEIVRLEVPAEWSGPWSDEDAQAWSQRTPPDQVRSQLVRSVGRDAPESFEFELRGPLKFSRQERPRAPDIQMLDTVAVDRYLALPTQDRGRTIVWETSGLRVVVQPDRWLMEAAAKNQAARDSRAISNEQDGKEQGQAGDSSTTKARSFQLYQIVSPRFQATVADVNEESPEARIRHAGHQLHLQPSGAGWGQTIFVAQGGGQHDCIVDVPNGEPLVQIRVAGELAVVDRLEDGGWRIPLVDTFYTQEIELLYQLAPHSANNSSQLAARLPRVRQWTTENSSIHVSGRSRQAPNDRQRWFVVALLIVLALAGSALHYWQGWRDWLAGGPALPAVLLGIGWWLWFEPQFLGFLIAAAGLLVANLPSTIRLGTKRGL